MKQIIIVIAIIGLFGTMTNLLYISPIPSIISALAFPFIISQKNRIPKIVFWVLMFFLISFLSVLTYYPKSFLAFGFYRYDGNFIISYLPLLILPFFTAKINIEKIFKAFLYFSTLMNVIAFTYYKLVGIPYFVSYFVATNAAGGFFSIMASLAFVFYLQKRTVFYLGLFLIQLGFMYATTSRGSMLGLVFGILFFYFIRYRKRYLIPITFAVIVLLQVVLIYNSYPVYEKNLKHVSFKEYYNTVNEYIRNNHGPVDGKRANIFIRLYDTWPRGVDAFLSSPIWGTGFGSINDIPFKHQDVIPYVVAINTQEKKQFNDSHAHHSYIHILGEQGILGLSIFLIFWCNIYRFLLRNTQNLPIRNFLLISFFNISIMSFTEHRITTPSNALPFVLAFCIYYIYINHEEKKQWDMSKIIKNKSDDLQY